VAVCACEPLFVNVTTVPALTASEGGVKEKSLISTLLPVAAAALPVVPLVPVLLDVVEPPLLHAAPSRSRQLKSAVTVKRCFDVLVTGALRTWRRAWMKGVRNPRLRVPGSSPRRAGM